MQPVEIVLVFFLVVITFFTWRRSETLTRFVRGVSDRRESMDRQLAETREQNAKFMADSLKTRSESAQFRSETTVRIERANEDRQTMIRLLEEILGEQREIRAVLQASALRKD